MKKRILYAVVMMICACVLAISVCASDVVASGTCGDNLTWVLDEEGTLTISGEGKMDDYYWNDNTPPWYRSLHMEINRIIIEEGVSSIGNYAFQFLSNVTSVEIANTVTSIGVQAFRCDQLRSITIPESVIDIYAYAISGRELSSIIFESDAPTFHGDMDDMHTIIYYPADNATWTSDVKKIFGSNIVWIETGSEWENFSGYYGANGDGTNIQWTLYQDGRLVITGYGDMYSHPKGYSITSPWKKYRRFVKTVVIEDGVESIGNCAFEDCYNITSINIPNSVISIEDSAFSGCYELQNVSIPESVTSLPGTFFRCISLKTIEIPESVTKLNYTFSGCTSLTTIDIPDSVTELDGTFQGCTNLKTIEIPESVTELDGTFQECTNLTTINIPDGVTILDTTFLGCESLKTIRIPDSVTSMCTTFIGCVNLESIVLSKNVNEFSYEVFHGCAKLKSITIPECVITSGNNMFGWCTNLSSIRFDGNIPELVDTEWSEVFNGITATVYYPANNDTWTEEIRNRFGGELTWVAYTVCDENSGHIDANADNICDACGTENVGTYTIALSTTTSEVPTEDKVYINITTNIPFSASELTLTYDFAHLTFNKSASILNGATVTDVNGTLTLVDYGDSKSSYTLAFDAIASGTAEIKLTSAAFGDAEDAASEDLTEAVIMTDSVSITIVELMQEVVLSDLLGGASSVEYGEDYTFSIIDYSEYYDYTVSATMADTTATVIDNGDGIYTIENVTGKLVISAERTPKEFYVIFETTTGVTLPNKSASVYGYDYTFTMPKQEHYSTDITQVSYMMHQINVPYTCENGVVTIKGKDIIDNIKIVIDQTLKDAEVSIEGSGADDVSGYEAYALGGETYTLTVTEDEKYDYAVTAKVNGESIELTVGEGTYTISADDVKPGAIVFTITKTIKLNAVTVSEYLTLDGNKLWLIKNAVTELDGMVYRYDGANMFWSDTYGAYCAIIASSAKPDVTVNNLSLVSGEALELTDTIDVNMSGKIDANDAQFVYNMYNGKYSGITENVTVEKYFRADVNRDGVINTLDAAAVVNHILTRNTRMLFSRRSEPSFHFELQADGCSEKTVQNGDIITFTFRVNRTDSAEDYIMYAMQNEIRYDSTVLELIEDSITVKKNVTTTDILYSAPDRELYMNYLAKSGNDVWPADTLVGSFQMKVIGTSGSATVSCQDSLMSRADGMGSYPVTCSDVTLKITDVQTVYGDTDGDNQLTPSDLDYLAKYWAGYPGYSIKEIPLEVLDVDSDGMVTRRDTMILERHFAGWKGYESLPLQME